jgi:hypothetical protein
LRRLDKEAEKARWADELPGGIQIVGPYLEDRIPIDFARRLADVVGGFEEPQIMNSSCFDRPVLSEVEGLSTNGDYLSGPFILSLSKGE